MKYNSIGEQLIAKAKELDPNYKPDKFNDMSEALNIILNNSGGGSGKDRDILDIGQYLIFNDGSNDKGIISQEGYEKLNSSNGKIIIAHFTNEMFDIDYPFIFEKWQEIDGTVYFVFYGIEIDSKSFKQHKKGILTINMNTKTFVADYENISENISDNLIFPTTSPSSQVIPSITTSNAQQNLSIGDGLEIKDGALKTKEDEIEISTELTVENISTSINYNSWIEYNESDLNLVNTFLKNQKGRIKVNITTPLGAFSIWTIPSIPNESFANSFEFEGSSILQVDLSSLGGSADFNQFIIRIIGYNSGTVSIQPTIIPIIRPN